MAMLATPQTGTGGVTAPSSPVQPLSSVLNQQTQTANAQQQGQGAQITTGPNAPSSGGANPLAPVSPPKPSIDPIAPTSLASLSGAAASTQPVGPQTPVPLSPVSGNPTGASTTANSPALPTPPVTPSSISSLFTGQPSAPTTPTGSAPATTPNSPVNIGSLFNALGNNTQNQGLNWSTQGLTPQEIQQMGLGQTPVQSSASPTLPPSAAGPLPGSNGQAVQGQYWDNATQSYKTATPGVYDDGSNPNLASNLAGFNLQTPAQAQAAALAAAGVGPNTMSVPTFGPNGSTYGNAGPQTGTTTYAGGTASGPGLAQIAAQNAANVPKGDGQPLSVIGQNADGSPIYGQPGASLTGLANPVTPGAVGSPSTVTTSTGGGALPATGGATPASTTSASPPSYATLQATDPNNPLTAQTILPGSGTNFTDLINTALKAEQTSAQPYFDAGLRDAMRTAAAGGALGSGQLESSIGDVTQNYLNQLTSAGLNQAVQGAYQQNQNNYANLGQLNEQQNFQNQQQQQAFNNALEQLTAGNANNPSGVDQYLAQLYGNEATGAGNALGNLINGTTTQNGTAASNNQLDQLLQVLLSQESVGGNSSTLDGLLSGGLPAPTMGVTG